MPKAIFFSVLVILLQVPLWAQKTEFRGDGKAIAELQSAWKDFTTKQKSGTIAEFTEYQRSKINYRTTVRAKGDSVIVREMGRDNIPSSDDSIFIQGPKYSFQLKVAKFPKNADEKETYNLVGMVPNDAPLDPQDSFFAWFVHADDVIYMPISFNNRRLSEFPEFYDSLEVVTAQPEKLILKFAGARKPENRDRAGELVLQRSSSGILQSAKWLIEGRDATGKVIEKLDIDREYFHNGDSFGFGEFQNGKFVGGYGQKVTYTYSDIPDAEFTPEFYGWDTAIAVGSSPTNWMFWGAFLGGVSLVALGLWIKRKQS